MFTTKAHKGYTKDQIPWFLSSFARLCVTFFAFVLKFLGCRLVQSAY
jgi:hypothetical protein